MATETDVDRLMRHRPIMPMPAPLPAAAPDEPKRRDPSRSARETGRTRAARLLRMLNGSASPDTIEAAIWWLPCIAIAGLIGFFMKTDLAPGMVAGLATALVLGFVLFLSWRDENTE